MTSALNELGGIDQGRIVGAYEARGGVVISNSGDQDGPYKGIRLYIETLTVTQPLHKVFGEPKVRAAYARPVYRYEVTRRSDVSAVTDFLLGRVFDPIRRKELLAVKQFCLAVDATGREKAQAALISARE